MMSTVAASLISFQLAAGALAMAGPADPPAGAAPAALTALQPARVDTAAGPASSASARSPALAPSLSPAGVPARGPAAGPDSAPAPAASDVPANWADAPGAPRALVAPVPPGAPAATSKLIREAVRDAIAEDHAASLSADREAPAVRRYSTQAPPDRFQAFAEQFDEARVPDCLHSEGLKRQPTSIGPFGVGGLLALPFVAIAKLRGKCN